MQLHHHKSKLTFSEKCRRLEQRVRQPQWRRYAALPAGGRVLGLLTLAAIVFVGPHIPDIL